MNKEGGDYVVPLVSDVKLHAYFFLVYVLM